MSDSRDSIVIKTTRTPNQLLHLNAACSATQEDSEQTTVTKASKEAKIYMERNPCKYCNAKFDTEHYGPGRANETPGCECESIRGKAQSDLRRNFRKADSHSKFLDSAIGISAHSNSGCISCCLCKVCAEALRLFVSRLKPNESMNMKKEKRKKSTNTSQICDDLNHMDDTDYTNINDYGIGIGEAEASESGYISSINGSRLSYNNVYGIIPYTQFLMPRVCVAIDEDGVTILSEITDEWPQNLDGKMSPLHFKDGKDNW
jgi:hypothetical protein